MAPELAGEVVVAVECTGEAAPVGAIAGLAKTGFEAGKTASDGGVETGDDVVVAFVVVLDVVEETAAAFELLFSGAEVTGFAEEVPGTYFVCGGKDVGVLICGGSEVGVFTALLDVCSAGVSVLTN